MQKRTKKSSHPAISILWRWSKRLFISALLVAIFSPQSHAFFGKVIEVPEGDLVVVSANGVEQRIRLYGVATPVKGQSFHEKARILTGCLSLKRNVEVTNIYRDAEGVMNALIRIDGSKENLNLQLIAYGLAWVKTNECSANMCSEWKAREVLAKSNFVGLWIDPDPIPPWEWKKQSRSKINQSRHSGTRNREKANLEDEVTDSE